MLDLFRSRSAGVFGRAQRYARGSRIPVTVVTGFLGAGKTTLIRRFLQSPQGRGTAVVVNEFGAAGIDDALMRASADETVLLGNGCLCCTVRSDLQVALRRLAADRQRGVVPHFGRVLIETSGLADPSPILQTFATDRALGGEFHAELVVAVVDAAVGRETLDWSAEARKQVIVADRLIITKTDLVDISTHGQLLARVRALNAHAEHLIAVNGATNSSSLFEPTGDHAARQVHSGFSAEAVHSDGIASFVLREEEPIAWDAFARTMETLTALRGPDLLRVKGFLKVAGCHGPVLVQFVQHLAHPPVELQDWADDDRRSRVVFITRGIREQAVRNLLGATRALAVEDRT